MAGAFHEAISPRKIWSDHLGVEPQTGDPLPVVPGQVVHEGETTGHVGHVLVGEAGCVGRLAEL